MSDKVIKYNSKKNKKRLCCTKRNKNRRPPNRHAIEGKFESVNTSAKRLKLSKNDYDIEVNESFGYRLINFASISSALSEIIVCKHCGKNVTFTEASKSDLGFKLVITCEGCEKVYINNFPLINNAYEINRRIILGMRKSL